MARPLRYRVPIVLLAGLILALLAMSLHAESPRFNLASDGSWASWRDDSPPGASAFWATTSAGSSELRVLFVPPECSLGIIIYRDHGISSEEPVYALPSAECRVDGGSVYAADAWVFHPADTPRSRTAIKSQPDGTELRQIIELLRSGRHVDIQIKPAPQDPERFDTWTERFMLDGFDSMYARANRLCE